MRPFDGNAGGEVVATIPDRLVEEYRAGRMIPFTLALVWLQRCMGSDSLRMVTLLLAECVDEARESLADDLRGLRSGRDSALSRDSCCMEEERSFLTGFLDTS